ncbi:protein involved in gliding motility RemC [Flavobacterium swingsii]|jgi:glycosyltransferase involved in cell wall biosynthesis|uniref:Protein involved in gliding motility RemC n=1 Tax=Flavobacterium swingsii TaxID=498292 RepID=A0A1I0ZBR1_9FLAO|nr:glycosyltransferase [Flavobacterium swingsii]SFB23199.1 protein involved in gliding motility RemC [Flavobacterium swingsii]
MQKKRILFLGETYRADAITWMNGLKEFGDFEIVTWELQTQSTGISRLKRLVELSKSFLTIRSIAKKFNADMVIAERTTSYGFLAALSGIKPIAIAQQGITDLWPENSLLYPFKKIIQNYAFKKSDLIHAWGPVMATHMQNSGVNMNKVMILPKGINLDFFEYRDNSNELIIKAIVTRSLLPEYKHDVILKAFAILKMQNIPFELTVVGDGIMQKSLKLLSKELQIENNVIFTGRINNNDLPKLLQKSNIYISMPTTEGVSASLFEAMACGCFPVVTNLPGNKSWITQKKNGILIESENTKKLAEEIIWAFRNSEVRQKAVLENRKFVEENANYAINMKKIADKYHQLINQKSD